MSSEAPKSQLEIEREQEAMLRAKYGGQLAVEKQQENLLRSKYGGMKPKKALIPKEHKFFDSADWALAKQGVRTEVPAVAAPDTLEPKKEPTAVRPRRVSHLGEADDE